eukprot:772199-Rhodomonas_salina.1
MLLGTRTRYRNLCHCEVELWVERKRKDEKGIWGGGLESACIRLSSAVRSGAIGQEVEEEKKEGEGAEAKKEDDGDQPSDAEGESCLPFLLSALSFLFLPPLFTSICCPGHI